MKKLITRGLAITAAVMVLTGCTSGADDDKSSSIFETQPDIKASENADDNSVVETENADSQNEVSESSSQIDGVSICDETTELDYDHNYDDEIRVAVERAVAESNSFAEEFSKMDDIQDHITLRRSQDQTQTEMNIASYYYYKVWDCELNNLWKRFTEKVDMQTKEKYLTDQRNWIAMKDEAVLEALGPREEGGSIYTSEVHSLLEESTKRRCYYLAKELAAVTGDSFEMPEKSLLGLYLDNQGTGDIYSSLYMKSGWESGTDADISLYRIGELHGTIEDDESGNKLFVSEDGNVKGIITYGWDGATFKVTEVTGDSIVSVNDVYEFPFVF
ncbi:lysozyme inhibitor LprI family protein [Butyrivibrio sp. YAB3001]|uniref:lysozyme inhibitor LprI family protein n=1 Tax=Butyrivibrio sp. YAB3001 TaxID=1520812 RepID=UPI0008F64B43|nr:lysozyme inhibitor LprI family protein [Butyrivibrio sp. YAB3001]SFC28396.1 Uncharacterized conserved protein YecT, DUF1311 family [Butyrivibrio sp. YAB3001]